MENICQLIYSFSQLYAFFPVLYLCICYCWNSIHFLFSSLLFICQTYLEQSVKARLVVKNGNKKQNLKQVILLSTPIVLIHCLLYIYSPFILEKHRFYPKVVISSGTVVLKVNYSNTFFFPEELKYLENDLFLHPLFQPLSGYKH